MIPTLLRLLRRPPLLIVAGAYVLAVGVAGSVALSGVYHLATALIGTPPASVAAAPAVAPAVVPPPSAKADISPIPRALPRQTLLREATLLPTQERFGSSSRGMPGPYQRRSLFGRLFGFDDFDDRPRGGTYRTVCVRLCDGYFFPVSFSVTSDRVERDAQVCQSRCGNQGRLFMHQNPGGSDQDMVDMAGRPYQQLQTAFLYRTQYVPSCKCQADPWEAESQDRHRAYALAAAVRKGDKDAVKELRALQSKAREVASATLPRAVDKTAPQVAQGGPLAGDEPLMRLSPQPPPAPRPAPKYERSDPDWRKRVFSN